MEEKKSHKDLSTKEKQNMLETVKAREITKTIMDFGVTQHQIRKIIEFLAMELEDRSTMLNVCDAVLEDSELDSMKTNIEI